MKCREIAPEQVLLGIVRESKALDDWFGLKRHLNEMRSKINPRNVALFRFSQDMPLSESSKRILQYALDEAEGLHHTAVIRNDVVALDHGEAERGQAFVSHPGNMEMTLPLSVQILFAQIAVPALQQDGQQA